MKPCIQYPGSKVKLSSRIVSLLGDDHHTYVEPYVGSAAVLLSKPPVSVETINDVDELLIAFYRVLRNENTRYRLIDSLTYTPYARAEFETAQDDRELDDVERARRFFIRTNQSFVGGSTSWVITNSGPGHSNATKWNNYRTRLSLIADRLQNVQIECKDAIEVLSKVWAKHDEKIAVYLDPPYLTDTRSGSKYKNEVNDQHHRDMLKLASEIKGRVVISAYEHPLYDDILLGWQKQSINVKSSGMAGQGAIAKRVEVLWSNHPVEAELIE